MKIANKILIGILILFGVLLFPQVATATSVSLDITANSGGAGVNEGSFSPDSVDIKTGDEVTISFIVPVDDLYCCGVQVKGNGGEFDTGTINKGETTTVTFTATSSFTFTSFWPGPGTPKATGNVNVTDPAPTAPAKPTGPDGTAVSTTQVDLSWNAPSGAISYEVYRNGNMIGTTSMVTYSDNGLKEDTSYKYKLKAVGSTGLKSDFSGVLTLSTKNVPTSPDSGNNNTPDGGELTPKKEVFTDPRYDYAVINEVIYTFEMLPELNPGDSFKIWGRTTAFANISLLLQSAPQTYSTIADQNGYWALDVGTAALDPGLYTFVTTITEKELTEGVTLEPIAFVAGQQQNMFTAGTTTPDTVSTITLSDQLREYSTVFMGVGGFLVTTGILLFLFKGRG